MRSIDIKSFILGVVATATVCVALGAASGESPQVGRYQIAAFNGVVIVDTTTGVVKEVKAKHIGIPFDEMAGDKK